MIVEGLTIGLAGKTDDLRACLRRSTAGAHDRLDSAMRTAGGWATRADYARFLALQHSARLPVEMWLADHAREGLEPPPQSPLIARDLAELGTFAPSSSSKLAVVAGGPAHMLGMAWVLAGSSLGNRSILKDIRDNGHADWPSAFLGDPAMLAFWKGLRPRIERPASHEEIADATQGANAVFDHFIAMIGATHNEPHDLCPLEK